MVVWCPARSNESLLLIIEILLSAVIHQDQITHAEERETVCTLALIDLTFRPIPRQNLEERGRLL